VSETLPVATRHVGSVIVPATGADGVDGWTFITAFADAGDVQPSAFVTVKVYVPAASPDTEVPVPEPFVWLPPGVLVIVHVPEDGSPLNATVPVDSTQVGCVIVPITGADGGDGTELITTFDEDPEVHPKSFVTLKVYVPAAKLVTVAVVPDPFVVFPPGLLVSVHVPVDGRPEMLTLPVVTRQVGCVMIPITGAEGAPGGVFRTRLEDAEDVHEEALVTVNVYVPTGIPVTVVEVPDPLVAVPPGDLVTVHDPEEGSPFRTTLPVGTVQVGCVIVPKVGAVGVDGCAFITIFPVAGETHPAAFETV